MLCATTNCIVAPPMELVWMERVWQCNSIVRSVRYSWAIFVIRSDPSMIRPQQMALLSCLGLGQDLMILTFDPFLLTIIFFIHALNITICYLKITDSVRKDGWVVYQLTNFDLLVLKLQRTQQNQKQTSSRSPFTIYTEVTVCCAVGYLGIFIP